MREGANWARHEQKRTLEKGDASTLMSPIVDARGMVTKTHSRKVNFPVGDWANLLVNFWVTGYNGVQNCSILYTNRHAAFWNTNRADTFKKFLKLARSMPGRHSKVNLKGNVTEPLGKLPQRDKESVNTYFPANRQLKYLLKVNWKQERSLSKIGNNSTHLESSFNYCYQKNGLANFQHKIIHHILPTNSSLFRDSNKKHDKYHLCSEFNPSSCYLL